MVLMLGDFGEGAACVWVLGFGAADWRWKSADWRWKSERAAECGWGMDGVRCCSCCCFYCLLLLLQSGTEREAEIHGVMMPVLVLGCLAAVSIGEKRKGISKRPREATAQS
jgi:hypothetical protein